MSYPLFFQCQELLGKPLTFWIKINCVLESFDVRSPKELETILDGIMIREDIIFDRAAEQLGGQVGSVPPINSNKEE